MIIFFTWPQDFHVIYQQYSSPQDLCTFPQLNDKKSRSTPMHYVIYKDDNAIATIKRISLL